MVDQVIALTGMPVDYDLDVSDSLSVAVYGRGPEDRPEAFRSRSAVRVADRLNMPVLLQQGMKDRIVPPDQVWRLSAALERAGRNPPRVRSRKRPPADGLFTRRALP